jgi:hypothetical protein
MPTWYPSTETPDTIDFGYLNTGNNGRGGDGTNYGDQNDNDYANFSPFNQANGADVDAHAGDYVHAYAYWYAEAGDGNANASAAGTGTGGAAYSNGDQYLETGGNTADVYAPTTATQTNTAAFYQGASQVAGIGGAGGSWNSGGDVTFSLPDTHTHTITVGDIDVSLDGLYALPL